MPAPDLSAGAAASAGRAAGFGDTLSIRLDRDDSLDD